jgi:hypothetical protein
MPAKPPPIIIIRGKLDLGIFILKNLHCKGSIKL